MTYFLKKIYDLFLLLLISYFISEPFFRNRFKILSYFSVVLFTRSLLNINQKETIENNCSDNYKDIKLISSVWTRFLLIINICKTIRKNNNEM